MRVAAVGLVVLVSASACGSQASSRAGSAPQDHDLRIATSVAARAGADAEATITSATFTARRWTVPSAKSNFQTKCTSGRLLKVRLIGRFPHIVTTGHPPIKNESADNTVTALNITADASDGRICLEGVHTGPVARASNATTIPLPSDSLDLAGTSWRLTALTSNGSPLRSGEARLVIDFADDGHRVWRYTLHRTT